MNAFIETKAPSKREVQKAETRARLLEVARAHFERNGFEASNLRSIASDAQVAVGTVLLHFSDKRDLLHAALFDDLDEVIERAVAEPSSGKLELRLRALVRPFFEYYAARPQLSKTLLREALLAESPWRERFAAQVTKVHAHIAALVEDSKLRSEVRTELDSALFGVAFFSFYYFALIAWVQGTVPAPLPLFERLLSEHMLGAMR